MGDYYTRVVVDDGDGDINDSCLDNSFVDDEMILKKQEDVWREMKP